ncbi:LysR family glycine cleavage system transcriptional activator [Sphingopyxis panaciterrae]|uniref:LysR substrate-binding domain-containing protein n=1 Tax=Sphingopyxis panaciterrae TaxID=363841 RepID=UPI00141F70EA|nr:LysR substrate-binding domain-containing protein [Sphingopyxis panaciterrae]NIJ37096.1 LysR family glycine cleavage system transcriptional activator [Sphingopyxis panaciterrae]
MARLPPLSSMEAFLEVARHGTVKAAAIELGLSMPALSRRIQTLEHAVGRPLFNRHHYGLSLTEAGRELQDQLSPILDELRGAISRAGSPGASLRLHLNVLPLFAQQRLFPRLPELRREHPELHIDIETMSHAEARLGEGIDAAIALSRAIDPALYAARLDQDKVFPIAARALSDGNRPITVPEQLQRTTILLHREMPETFSEWKQAIGMPYLEPAGIDFFDSGPLMLEAAAQGIGVAFMHGHHFDDAQDPRLIRLFDFDVDSPYSYWFVCRPRALRQPAVKLFHDWLLAAKI